MLTAVPKGRASSIKSAVDVIGEAARALDGVVAVRMLLACNHHSATQLSREQLRRMNSALLDASASLKKIIALGRRSAS